MPTEAREVAPELPHALERRDCLETELGDRRLAVFLDYDGTLCPIVSRPELAVIDAGTRASLDRLSRRHPVAVVSGRELSDVRERVDLPALYYSGNHGYEIDGPAGSGVCWEIGSDYVDEIARLRRQIEPALTALEGLIVENKRYSLSIHYRQLQPSRVPAVQATLERALGGFSRLTLRHGKCVFEVRPELDWHKGKAVRRLLDALGGPATLPIYVGDDVTDEDAFRELGDQGVGILVSEQLRPTAARFWLRNVDEVRRLLDYLALRP